MLVLEFINYSYSFSYRSWIRKSIPIPICGENYNSLITAALKMFLYWAAPFIVFSWTSFNFYWFSPVLFFPVSTYLVFLLAGFCLYWFSCLFPLGCFSLCWVSPLLVFPFTGIDLYWYSLLLGFPITSFPIYWLSPLLAFFLAGFTLYWFSLFYFVSHFLVFHLTL